mgnify:FL=1
MRKISFLLCLLMTTAGLAGCLGTDIETSEGDDVVLGESTDDWPTYYVPTSGDLPTCDSTILGRLYYVEADTNFQACMSGGWQVVQLGGSGGNILMNQPPIVEANVWLAYEGNEWTVDDGDGTYSVLYGLHWNVSDPDGTISQVGIDTDGDMVIDIALSSNSGAFSGDDHENMRGVVMSGFFAVPMENGLTFHRGETASSCKWGMTRTLNFVAIDDDGAKAWSSVSMNAFDPRTSALLGMLYSDAYRAMEIELSMPGFFTQSDYDWIMGVGSSNCPGPALFTLTFDSGAVSSGDSDILGVLTLVSGAPTTLRGQDGCSPMIVGLSLDGSNQGQPCGVFSVQFSGTDSANPTAGDTWTIGEAGVDVCNPTNLCDGVYVDFFHDDGSGDSVSRRIYAP